MVDRLLCTVPDKYLQGLDSVVLTKEANLPRRDRVGKVWSRRRKRSKSLILGRYHPRSRSSPAYIELRVDKIIGMLRGAPYRIPLLRHLGVGHVLFHEIGHHIHRTFRPEHKEKEDVADRWAGKLNVNFIRRHYWYAMPIIVPAAKIYRFFRRKGWM
jgi:hypothetical protein